MSKEWAIKIKTVDMEEKPLAEGEKTMVDFSTDTAKEAMLANAYEQDVASYIKNAFDKKYGCARAIAAAIAAARASRRATAAATRPPAPPPRTRESRADAARLDSSQRHLARRRRRELRDERCARDEALHLLLHWAKGHPDLQVGLRPAAERRPRDHAALAGAAARSTTYVRGRRTL